MRGGLAGLIKAARAVHTGVRPPTLHIDRPNPAWQADSSPFFFDDEARPWAQPPERRIAGVSAFGFGGTNYHAVLAGHTGAEEPRHGLEEWPAEVFFFRGEDRRAAGRAMARLAARLEENDTAGRPWALRDLAAEVAADPGPVQVAVVAAGLDELAARLERPGPSLPARGSTYGRSPLSRGGWRSCSPGRAVNGPECWASCSWPSRRCAACWTRRRVRWSPRCSRRRRSRPRSGRRSGRRSRTPGWPSRRSG